MNNSVFSDSLWLHEFSENQKEVLRRLQISGRDWYDLGVWALSTAVAVAFQELLGGSVHDGAIFGPCRAQPQGRNLGLLRSGGAGMLQQDRAPQGVRRRGATWMLVGP